MDANGAALGLLLRAWDCAQDCHSDPWALALEVAILRAAGLTTTDLRWLTLKGYVRHAIERTKAADKRRVFGATDHAVITDKSAFVLTAVGAEAARQLPGEIVAVPFYDRDVHELWFEKRLVKSFRRPAPDQHIVLSSFQEEHWPLRLDSPLSPQLLLHHVIRRLNQHQIHPLLRFLGDGSAEGIRWQRR